MTITRDDLLKSHDALCAEAKELMTRKNADYGATADPFANFRMAALLKIDPALGALLRMQDKMARLVSFIEKGQLAVKEEGWHDCIVDLINYSVILHGLLAEHKPTFSQEYDKALSDQVGPCVNVPVSYDNSR